MLSADNLISDYTSVFNTYQKKIFQNKVERKTQQI